MSDSEDEEFDDDVGEFGTSVDVKVCDFVFPVSIGEGNQDVRWLALTAAQRYSSYVRANSKSRKHENVDLEHGNFLPKGCKLGQRQLDPHSLLCQVLQNHEKCSKEREQKRQEKACFIVELCKKVSLGDDGAPKLQQWLSRAFTHSMGGKHQVERLQSRQSSGEEESNQDDSDCDDERVNAANHLKAPGFCNYFNSEQAASDAFEEEWETWVRPLPAFQDWFHTAESLLLDTNVQQKVKDALCKGFESLSHLVDNYSWQWRRKESLVVNVPELEHLLHHCGVVTLPEQGDFLKETVALVCPKLRSNSLFTRGQVVALLVAIAHQQTKSRPSTFASRVEEIVQQGIMPAAQVLRGTDLPSLERRVFGMSAVSRIFRGKRTADIESSSILQRVFKQYCIRSSSLRQEPTMHLREFKLFMQDALPQSALQGLRAAANRRALKNKINPDGILQDTMDEEDDEYGEHKKELHIAKQLVSQDLFFRAQHLSAPTKNLQDLVFTEFVNAIILSLYDAETEIDTWDMAHGSDRLISLIGHLASVPVDVDTA